MHAEPGQSPASPLTSQLLADAPAAADGHFDELRGALSGVAQAQWAAPWTQFFAAMPQLDADGLDQRLHRLQRMVREHGASYHVYDDSQGSAHPWRLELFPLLLSADEWARIARGVQQRARLLEHIMADVYGPQHLLRDRMLPAALVQGHPGYMRAMHGMPVRRHLHVVAFDLVRGTDGHWWLMGQRTQAPSGLGYLLENRYIVRQVFSQAYAQMAVRPVTASYRILLQGLQQQCRHLAPQNALPTVVWLTPGPHNETWFEQAYLARNLGIALVEGCDLTVREQKLYLKTLHGLTRVHGVLRRVDDDWVDPLELRPESLLGVPGLLQAVRAGQVVVANSPGSGFMESPALLGFMPPIAEQVLGEPLALPALPTWWCGEQAVLQQVLPQLGRMAIKPTYTGSALHHSFAAVLGSQLDAPALQALAQRIQQQGEDYTVQHYMPLSQLPGWQAGANGAGRWTPRSLVLRVFALGDGSDHGWHVLPGGMARLANRTDGIASMQRGGGSAGVWVLGETPCLPAGSVQQTQPEGVQGLPPSTPSTSAWPDTRTAQQPGLLISRMAENLFWLGRYTERSENAAHLALISITRLRDPDRPGPTLLRWLQAIALDQDLLPQPAPDMEPGTGDAARALEYALRNQLETHAEPTGLAAAVAGMQRSTQALRSELPHQHWHLVQQVVQAERRLHHPAGQRHLAATETLSQLHHVSHALVAVTGMQLDRLARTTGWQLLQLGRMTERLSHVANVLQHALQQGVPDDDQAAATLAILFNHDTQLLLLQMRDAGANAATWQNLFTDPHDPHALAGIVQEMQRLLALLPAAPDQPPAAGSAPGAPDDAQGTPAAGRHWPQLQALWLPLAAALSSPDVATQASQDLLAQCMALAAGLTRALDQTYFNPINDASQSVGA